MEGAHRAKLIQRLIQHHSKVDDHWIWTGNIGTHGYGTLHFLGGIRLVHRLSAVIFLGLEIDDKTRVKHSCDRKDCFNPEHLIIKKTF